MSSPASSGALPRRSGARAALLAVLIATAVAAAPAHAASAGPGWMVSSVAEPTNFSKADNALCHTSIGVCDTYFITVTNVGGAAATGTGASGPIRIVDTLPPGLKPAGGGIHATNLGNLEALNCNEAASTCEYPGTVAPGGVIAMLVEVEVVSGVGPITNSVHVEGGAAAPAATGPPSTMPNTVGGAPALYGIAGWGFQVSDAAGASDGQAGDHPTSLTTIFNLNTVVETRNDGRTLAESPQNPRYAVVSLPLGLVGDATAAAKCTAVQLQAEGGDSTICPPASRIGNIVRFSENNVTSSVEPRAGASADSAIYNIVPESGYPAEFGFKVFGKTIFLYPSVVHTASGYVLRVNGPGIPRTIGFEGLELSFFGDPNVENGEPNNPHAFLTNPSDCGAGPLTAKLQTDSWAEPGVWHSAEAVAYPQIIGCNLLQFEPQIEMRPEVTEAESPTGFEVKIKAPQSPNQFPVLATTDLRNVTMTLPEGMTVSPGAADGLVACAATGSSGIDMPSGEHVPDVAGEGEAIGADGLSHLSPGHCPPASQIGTVDVKTPVLKDPLEGQVYLAEPECGGAGQHECTSADARSGRLFGLYLEVAGSGIVVKLGGRVSADPTTGRLTARFTELPQFPLSEVTLKLKGGSRAPLANPRQCGAATTNSDITPWGAPVTPDALPISSYEVGWEGGGTCPASLPFAPTLVAGSASVAAGRFAPFTLTVNRSDRNKDLSKLQVKLPPGLLGEIASVPLCQEPQAARGDCPEASLVGHVSAAVGSGPHPFVVTSGRAYLTSGYRGAPFGLTVVVPAVAGPFNLGNVVVRSAISVDPHTSAITITSDPLPQILDGVPLRIQTLNVSVDRPGFMFNPTSCAKKQITARIEAAQGGFADVSSPFAVEGCNTMPFNPTFKVSTQGNGTFGGGAKGKGASLDVKITQAPGEPAIGKVDVQLPLSLPSRLTTLQQACTEAQFAANPAGCPAGSQVGFAKATTPVLKVPLTGPAYLVSHGGAAFPDLVVVLQGNERGGHIRIDLVGHTDIKKGITYSNFDTVPDAPISSFELTLPEGPHSVLAAIKNLCALTKTITVKSHGKRVKRTVPDPLLMPTTITGQNGAVIKQSTKIAVTGCVKARATKARHGHQASKHSWTARRRSG
jgi:hypothetical protein